MPVFYHSRSRRCLLLSLVQRKIIHVEREAIYFCSPSLWIQKIAIYFYSPSLWIQKIAIYFCSPSLWIQKIAIYFYSPSLWIQKIAIYFCSSSLWIQKIHSNGAFQTVGGKKYVVAFSAPHFSWQKAEGALRSTPQAYTRPRRRTPPATYLPAQPHRARLSRFLRRAKTPRIGAPPA